MLLADFAKQRDLAVGRGLPVELLGIGTGRGARRRRREEIADCGGEALRGHCRDDPAGRRGGDDVGNAGNLRHHDRRAAGHAFEQHIGPALMRRDQQQQIGRLINLREPLLRQSAEQPNALGDPARPRRRLDRAALGPVADDDQIGFRQQCQRFDHQLVPLQRNEIARPRAGSAG